MRAVGSAQQLKALDEIPPPGVVIAVGLGGQAAVEVRHDEYPAGEDEQVGPAGGTKARREFGDRRRRDARRCATTTRVAHESAAAHRDTFGEADVHRPQEPGQIPPDPVEVDRVTELVQHRLRPTLAGSVVGEHSHVTDAVDVDAERVLDLARSGRQVAATHDAAYVESHRRERPHGERFEIGTFEIRIEIDADCARCVLKEGVVVVPGPQRVDGDSEAGGELGIEVGFEIAERRGR